MFFFQFSQLIMCITDLHNMDGPYSIDNGHGVSRNVRNTRRVHCTVVLQHWPIQNVCCTAPLSVSESHMPSYTALQARHPFTLSRIRLLHYCPSFAGRFLRLTRYESLTIVPPLPSLSCGRGGGEGDGSMENIAAPVPAICCLLPSDGSRGR